VSIKDEMVSITIKTELELSERVGALLTELGLD